MRPSRGMGDMRASKMPKGAMMAGGGDVKGKRASDEEADLAKRIAAQNAAAVKSAGAAAKGAPIRGQGTTPPEPYKPKGIAIPGPSRLRPKGITIPRPRARPDGPFHDSGLDRNGQQVESKYMATERKGGSIKAKKMVKGGNFIKDAIKKPGALRASLGAKPGKPIPAGKLDKATKAPGKLGQRARFAEMLKGFKKNKK